MPASSCDVRVFGVRHLGPGSAATLARALDAFRPDRVLVEGPPDAGALLDLVGSPGLRPPVALLVFREDDPGRTSLQPYAEFSPEWVAVRHARAHGVPVSFVDLPQATRLAMEPDGLPEDDGDAAEVRTDPMSFLGDGDAELWWDEIVESGIDAPVDAFAAVADAMGALRAEIGEPNRITLLREACMRGGIRQAGLGHARVAVVCGAWHVPALLLHDAEGQAERDAAMLRGLPRTKVGVAWVPWSHERMTRTGGYGAGVRAPAWYATLWAHGDRAPVAWMSRAAGLLRAADLDASTASAVEAVNLAHGLAALHGRSTPGLDELEAAALSVLCAGEEAPLDMIRRDLVIGRDLGTVPDGSPTTPLQADFARSCRSLKLAVSATHRRLELDLRKDTDLARSVLFRRMLLLGVDWAVREEDRASIGTFRETWTIEWKPEHALVMVGASRHGATVAAAASSALGERVRSVAGVADLAAMVLEAVEADLPVSAMVVVAVLQDRAALSSDVFDLMSALPPLAELARYGSVRRVDVSMVADLVAGIVPRVAGGLTSACRALDDTAAMPAAAAVARAGRALAPLADGPVGATWSGALEELSTADGVHGLVAGRAVRMRIDGGLLPVYEAGRMLSLALSRAAAPGQAAAWLEGLLAEGATLLLHGSDMLPAVDAWLCDLDRDAFVETLPVLRRAFSSLPGTDRRALGERISGDADRQLEVVAEATSIFDRRRMDAVMPVLGLILGAAADVG